MASRFNNSTPKAGGESRLRASARSGTKAMPASKTRSSSGIKNMPASGRSTAAKAQPSSGKIKRSR